MTHPVNVLEPGAGLFAALAFELDRLARSKAFAVMVLARRPSR